MDDDKWRDEIAKELLRQRTKEDQIASIAGSLDVLRKWPIFRVELEKNKKVHTYSLRIISSRRRSRRRTMLWRIDAKISDCTTPSTMAMLGIDVKGWNEFLFHDLNETHKRSQMDKL